MAIKVGINGFGRIGRVALRIMVERGSATYQMCGINLRNVQDLSGHGGAGRPSPDYQRQEDPGLQ